MTLTEFFTNIANAIRGKTGESGSIPAVEFPDRISQIMTGIDTSDATAVSGDILSGKTAYADGQKLTGTIVTKTSSNLTASGATVTVPAGYYASSASKSVSTAAQATPSISVSSSGLITASTTQSAGYVSSGTKSATKQLTTQAAKTITPSTSAQTAVSSGVYTTGAVTVAGDSNLVASNIKNGASVFGVAGSYKGGYAYVAVDRTEALSYVSDYVFGDIYIDETAIELISSGSYDWLVGQTYISTSYGMATVQVDSYGTGFFMHGGGDTTASRGYGLERDLSEYSISASGGYIHWCTDDMNISTKRQSVLESVVDNAVSRIKWVVCIPR